MNASPHEAFTEGEIAILSELLESERARLLVEIRHTHHRSFRYELRARLTIVEDLEHHEGCHSSRL